MTECNDGSIKISMYALSRLEYVCRNVISICDLMEKGIEKERVFLCREALSGYMSEMTSRYLELLKELDKP